MRKTSQHIEDFTKMGAEDHIIELFKQMNKDSQDWIDEQQSYIDDILRQKNIIFESLDL